MFTRARAPITAASALLATLALARCAGTPAAAPAQGADAALDDTGLADTTVPTTADSTTDAVKTADNGSSIDFFTASDVINPGSFGAPCQVNGDCDSAYCIPGPSGKICTKLCIDSCPDGFQCAGTGATGDVTFICIPRWQHLCDPCTSDAACVDPLLGAGAQCLDYGADGAYCGTSCVKESDCPSGYACGAETGPGGKVIGQCRRTSGLCACSASAMAGKLATTCGHTSPFGVCKGVRGCSDSGLSACTAGVPKAELCNGLDDNCDGTTDEGIGVAPCVQSNALGVCAGQTACVGGKTACQGPVPAKETCNGKDDDCDGETDETSCDDGNPCTEDACNLTVGGCIFAQVTKPCNDGDVCTTSDTCNKGACAGEAVKCSDGDVCTTDSCDGKAVKPGCQFALAPDGLCDDGDPCTAGDLCLGGNGSKLACAGVALADGASCTDGNACTLAAACAGGKCKATLSACDDANPCTDDSCDAAAGGACKHFYNIAACDDTNACTLGDSCFAGKCLGLGKTPCDDNDACTADSCDAKIGGCVHLPKEGAGCSDGDLCTTGDTCAVVDGKSVCKGAALKCDDGKVCTADACNPGFGCEHIFVVAPCDDGDPCSKGDNCQAGQCVPGEYSCGECVNNSDCKVKEDGNLCNGTLYCEKQGHTCVVDLSTVITCPAPIGGAAICITATCDVKSGKCAIAPANEGGACDDSNACTAKDACKKGVCAGIYGNLACDDANPCTQDICDPASGCTSLPLQGVACNDGDACSQGDTCDAGKCKAGAALVCDDGNPCTTDGCDANKGCVHNVNTLPCSDGNVCTTGDTCLNAVCTPKGALACDDNNICTADFCDAKLGCQQLPADGIQCNDGNACTSADKCTKGQCVGGGQLPCSDGNICTDDACDPKSGCTFTPNLVPCNDGNACTDSDACQGGGCKAGKPLDCNDANTCTVDLCDPAKGCAYQKVIDATPCNDSDLCTVSDKCSGGICLAGTKLVCNDGQACTTDKCDVKIGCVYTPLLDGSLCDDANVCTLVDKCALGKCVGVGVKDLDKDGHIDSKCPGGDDCDDTCGSCFPGQKELCDDLDNDCKNGVDDGCDDDNDDYCDSAMQIPLGVVPKTCAKGGGDCDDTNAAVNPGAVEKLEVDVDQILQGAQQSDYGPLPSSPLGLVGGVDGSMWALWQRFRPTTLWGWQLYVAGRAAGQTFWTLYSPSELRAPNDQVLAVDAQGMPHILYWTDEAKTTNRLIRHAWLAADGWTLETVATEPGTVAHLGVAVRNGVGGTDMHAVWYDGKNFDLRYASHKAGKWSVSTIDSIGDVGQFASLAVDSKGAVDIAYHDSTNHDLRYATDAGSPGVFAVTIVDGSDSAAGFYCAIALDANDKAHIAHYELLGSDLRYTSNASGGWKTEIVDAPGTVGQYAAIAVASDGTVHISYRDDDKTVMKHAWGKPGAWINENLSVVIGNANKSQRAPIVMTGTDTKLLWGFGTAGPSSAWLDLAVFKAGKWTTSFVDDALMQYNVGGMAGRSDGPLTAGDIAVIGGSNAKNILVGKWLGKGMAWRGYPDPFGPSTFHAGNLAVSAGGVAFSCGSNYFNGTMMLVKGTWDGGFTGQVVDTASKAGLPCDVALDGSGTAHIVYYDKGNQVMRYRSALNGVLGAADVPDASFGTGNTLDLIAAADGSLMVAYGGGSLRVATRPAGKPWSIEVLSNTQTLAVALLKLANNDTAMYFVPGAGPNANSLYQRVLTGGVWGPESKVANVYMTVDRLAATLDSDGAVHLAALSYSTLNHLTNKFGGWSQDDLKVSMNSSEPLDIVTAKDGRVLVVGTDAVNPSVDIDVSFTYQNLVDDNCDGK